MAGCPLDCSGHGTCDKTSQKCQCYEEWKGDGCNVPICPGDNCGPYGTCSLSNHRKGCNCNHRYRGMCTPYRVPTRTGKSGKPGKMGRHFPVMEKSGNFEQTGKVC